ncbi:MAG: hypothetical protein K2P86_08745 [Xanthobacteraceae bacterium]|jgi:hypothetical protein|nr:hypothetical protein [Xanthobacteraceae bacterium]
MQRISALAALAALLIAVPAFAFENELLGKRDVDVPQYKSEQGMILFDEKGAQTEFGIEYGAYKKNYVLLLLRDTGARTKTDSTIFEIIQVVRVSKPRGLDLYTVGCYLKPGPDSQPGEYVMAFARFKAGSDGPPSALTGAWMFDWQTKRIVAVPEQKVDCREPGG